jgi:hypothetical protein
LQSFITQGRLAEMAGSFAGKPGWGGGRGKTTGMAFQQRLQRDR